MKDQSINKFYNGLSSDLSPLTPQEGVYNYAENIRIISDGTSGESAAVTNVIGNALEITLVCNIISSALVSPNPTGSESNDFSQSVTTEVATCTIIGYTTIKNKLIFL